MKKVFVISASPRRNSNSDLLAKSFMDGAKSSGHEVTYVSLREKEIHFCQGCFTCQKTQRCFMRDDADSIEQQMQYADVLVFATPIYYYEMSGQLKTMLDRANPLYPSEYAFREIYFMASAAEEGEEVFQRALSGVTGWAECFTKARLAGSVFVGGVTEPGEAKEHPALQQAYEMGVRV